MVDMIQINAEAGEQTVFESPGLCIYCGRSDIKLNDEHIIPYAMLGDAVILEQSSCQPCADHFNKQFESYCFRTLFYRHRVSANAPSRRRKKRAPIAPTVGFILRDEEGRQVGEPIWKVLPIGQVPHWLAGWIAPTPGILAGREPSIDIPGRSWSFIDKKGWWKLIEEVREETGAASVVPILGELRPHALLRWVAKVAYAYSVAMLGYSENRRLPIGAIYGRTPHISHYVGGECTPVPNKPNDSFTIAMGTSEIGGRYYTYVQFHPYPLSGAPPYIVILGKDTQSDLSLPQNRPKA